MSYLPLLLSLFVVDLLAAMSPGPNFVLVTQTAIRRGFLEAGAVVLGLLAANMIWCAAVVLGLSTLLAVMPWLYAGIKVSGGLYLLHLGVRLWREPSQLPSSTTFGAWGRTTAFTRGVLTNLTNPKSVVYFGSIFAVFLDPAAPAWVECAAVAIVLTDTILWYGTVAALFSRRALQRVYGRTARWINRAAGTLMIAFGARLVLARE
jgi:threonine efflux protein